MNLVNELQVSAETDDVLTVLRKTKRLASKLGRKDISEWLQAELEGYGPEKSLPQYRHVRATLAMKTNGYIPAGYGYLMQGIQELPGFGINPAMPIIDPISEILSWQAGIDKGNGIYLPINRSEEADRYVRQHIHPLFRNQVDLMLRLNESQLQAIPEQIKDKVLDWACALEEAGVNGEGQSFSDREKEIAHSVTINISDSRIEQLTNSGTNQRG